MGQLLSFLLLAERTLMLMDPLLLRIAQLCMQGLIGTIGVEAACST